MNDRRRDLRPVSPAVKTSNDLRHRNAVAFAIKLGPILERFSELGFTQRRMVEELNKRGIKTAKGARWTLSLLQRVLDRLKQKEL